MQHQDSPVRIVFTGGGTGGHVSPILAVIDELQALDIAYEPLWIGSKQGAERRAADEHAIPYKAVSVGKLRRYVSLRTVPDTARVPLGVLQSLPALRRFRPDVIFSTGGYVGVPAVVAGRMLGIPSLTHEQTAALGLATRINARFSRTVALSHDRDIRPRVAAGGRVIVTGNPIRSWLHDGSKEKAGCRFGLNSGLPVIYVTGGAQGALAINDAVEAALPELLEFVEIVHQTGPNEFNGSYDKLTRSSRELPEQLRSRYHLTERVGRELGDLYAAADIVLGRSGAGTVAELAALGLPSILIPLPGAVEQLENARILERAGAAVIVDQANLTPERLIVEISSLAESTEKRDAMVAAARSTVGEESPARLLVEEILALADLRASGR
ncbi:MAG: undecaprenyldiphospho-muramoylpentapeptide beta-N-acetylglucosaminyltransferase [Thermomicrobiales bacterium]